MLWKVKEQHLKPYQQYLEDLTKTFDKIEYTIIPKAQSQFPNALATLASIVGIPEGVWTRLLEIEQSYKEVHKGKTKASVMTIKEEEVLWHYDIMKFLELRAYLDGADKREHRSIRMMAIQYILCGGKLYKKSYDGIHLRCLKKEEAEKGIDVIKRIAPKASNGHEHILVAIDYFTKWIKSASYSILKAKHVARFLENNIICQFVVPQEIISDNGSHFEGEVRRVMEEYNIEPHKFSPYQPQANRAIEATNKNVKNILAKMVITYKEWAEKLPFTLWGYKISICASTGVAPYSLVYGSEVVLPIKVEIQSLRVLVETKVLEEDQAKARYEQLALIDEKRTRAQYHAQGYQQRIARAFNKKVKLRKLKERDLVLKVLRDENFYPRGKMKPRWFGPFIIKKIMSGGATRITDLEWEEMLHLINMDRLRKYNI
ncbi:uncharacterized protein LOC142634989 [Castanea sativa]|uniref:uncharacterized protein LOC142634989 n=1 Tax=Castanea sativa TaxID=21020 RepID=UPI003F64B23F